MSLRSRKKAGDGQLADSQEFLSLDLFKPGNNQVILENIVQFFFFQIIHLT